MNYFLKKKKWMACLVLLTFLFTSIMPTNLAAGDSMAWAAAFRPTPVEVVNTVSAGITMEMKNWDGQQFSTGGFTDSGHITPGVVRNTLGSNGYPVLSGGGSLEDYFKGTSVNGLFIQDVYESSGYYSYSSFENSAILENGKLQAYEELMTPKIVGDTASALDKVLYRRGNFLPYNSFKTEYTADEMAQKVRYDESGSPLGTAGATLYTPAESPEYYFGLAISAKFTQPEGGMVSHKGSEPDEMIFSFNGDDDLWVFIDKVLVLDIGGIHIAQTGSINFATGDVIVTSINAPGWGNPTTKTYSSTIKEKFEDVYGNELNSTDFNGDTFANFTEHEIKIFYMERGAGGSDLKMEFNLPTVPANPEVQKIVEVNEEFINPAKEYQFDVKVSEKGAADGADVDDQKAYTGRVIILDQNDAVVSDGTISNGSITLKHGETAALKVDKNEFVRFEETNGTNDFTKHNVTQTNPEDGSQAILEDRTENTGVGKKSDWHQIEFTNAGEKKLFYQFFNTVNKADLTITKQLDTGLTDNATEFQFKVYFRNDVGGGNLVKQMPNWTLYTGDWTLSKPDPTDSTKTVSEDKKVSDGYIYLNAGETAVLKDIPVGTKYFVEEVLGSNSNYEVKNTNLKTVVAKNGDVVASGALAVDRKGIYGTIEAATPTANTVEIINGKYHSISGTKTWVDGNKQHNNAAEIILKLYREIPGGQAAEVSYTAEQLTWNDNTYTFSGLDKYDANGYEYTYTVREYYQGNGVAEGGQITVNGTDYTVSYNDNAIINTIVDPENGTLAGSKTWVDGNVTHVSANEVTLKLYRAIPGGQPVEVSYAASQLAWDGDDFTFTGLEVYDANGNVYTYTVSEDGVVNGKVTINGREFAVTQTGNNITNTIVDPENGTLAGSKTWVDGNVTHVSANEVTLKLYRAIPGGQPVEVSYAASQLAWDGDDFTFTGLEVYDANGNVYTYTVSEDGVVNGKVTINGREFAVTQTGNNITNTIVDPENGTLAGSKTWVDGNVTHVSANEVTLKLYRAIPGGQPVEVSYAENQLAWNGDRFTFTGLEVYDANGNVYTYTVSEAGVVNDKVTINGREFAVTQTGNNIINTIAQEYITVSGTKVWCDNSDQDGVRPESITVNLLADDEVVDSKAVMGEGDSWSYEFTELPKYSDDGAEIVYTITENEVDYYTTSIDGYTITNAYEPVTTKIIGEKIWDDENHENKRPASITVNLYADGEIFATTTATALDWSYAFTDLPVYKDGGQAIAYRVVEDPESARGYVPSYSVEKANGGYVIDITNTYSGEDAEFVTISGNKVWNDNNNAMGKRPTSITVNLLRNGVEIDEVKVTADDNWAYAFTTDLPKADEEGNAYEYTVTEDAIDEYRAVITKTSAGYDITNTLITGEAGQLQVSKVVSGDNAPANGAFKFVLNVEASKPNWDALKVWQKLQLEDAYNNALKEQEAAEEAWKAAKADFAKNARKLRTTGSAIQFAMAEATSPSCYEYLMIEADARITSTTSSSYNFAGLAAGKADASLVDQVIEAIRELAAEFSRANSVFLKALQSEVSTTSSALEFTTPSALGFMKDDAQNLLNKADRLFEANALVETTSAAVYEFVNSPEVTTPAAITMIITDAKGNKTEVTTTGAYQYEFTLYAGKDASVETFKFDFEVTTGSSITYSIEEVEWVEADYKGTTVTLNGEDVTSNRVRYTGVQELTSDIVNSVVFTNIYAKKVPDVPTYVPPYVPPVEPEEIIPEPEVPAGEPPVVVPGEEIFEEEIPLGDAPRTGDVNDAMPFMAMMLFALTGMVITRRKFN